MFIVYVDFASLGHYKWDHLGWQDDFLCKGSFYQAWTLVVFKSHRWKERTSFCKSMSSLDTTIWLCWTGIKNPLGPFSELYKLNMVDGEKVAHALEYRDSLGNLIFYWRERKIRTLRTFILSSLSQTYRFMLTKPFFLQIILNIESKLIEIIVNHLYATFGSIILYWICEGSVFLSAL